MIRTPLSHCLHCGKLFDAASNIDDDGRDPMPGDFTMCLYCGYIAALDDKLQPRGLTFAEMIVAANDEDIVLAQRTLMKIWQRGDHGTTREGGRTAA